MGKRKNSTACDQLLLRVRETIGRRDGVTEKRMFGGYCFLANGHMVGGVMGNGELIVRVGPDGYSQALERPFAREMDFTGRPMRGFVVVDEPGFATDEGLTNWLELGLAFARSLPPKTESR